MNGTDTLCVRDTVFTDSVVQDFRVKFFDVIDCKIPKSCVINYVVAMSHQISKTDNLAVFGDAFAQILLIQTFQPSESFTNDFEFTFKC